MTVRCCVRGSPQALPSEERFRLLRRGMGFPLQRIKHPDDKGAFVLPRRARMGSGADPRLLWPCALSLVSWCELDLVRAAWFQSSFLVAQLRGLVLRLVWRCGFSSWTATNFGADRGGAAGRTKGSPLFPMWLMGVAAWRRWRLVPSQWGTPLRFVSLAGFGALEGLGGQQLFRQPITQWTPHSDSPHDYIVVRLSRSLSPLSRQSYADNAGDRTRSPDPRRSQFRALPASLSAVEFLWHRDISSTRPCHAPSARVRLFCGVPDRTSPSDRTAQSGVEACLALGACLDPEKTSARCLRPDRGFIEACTQDANCSFNTLSSRLNSGSKSKVIAMSRFSWISTATTSRASVKSATALTGRLSVSSTSILTCA